MPQFIHLNGPPGIGKSTLSALYTERHPGTLNLDVDQVHHLVGGWQDEETDTWPVVSSLVRAMAAAHLGGGHDVILPQYLARLDEITAFEKLAHEHGADFREMVLLADRATAIDRFNRRAEATDDPWIRHHHRLIEQNGGAVALGAMYDKLREVVGLRPAAMLIPSVPGEVQETYALLASAISGVEPDSGALTRTPPPDVPGGLR